MAGIPLSSQFNPSMQLPLDQRTVAADLTERDAITAIKRYEGLIVYVESEASNYQLQGGITNSDWVEIAGGGGGAAPDIENEGLAAVSSPSALNFKGLRVKDAGGGRAEISPPDYGAIDRPMIFGECASPLSVTAAGGITKAQGNMDPSVEEQVAFVQGSGGAVNISRNPQIQPHTLLGAKLTLVGKSETNTLTLEDGDGLSLNGPAELGENDVLSLIWNGTVYVETRRNF
jgi:hypothetical protein